MAASPTLGRSLRVPSALTGTASARDPSTLKRTASTASVNERVMDMLNPAHKQRYVDDDGEDSDMGMQEDWEVEPDPEEEEVDVDNGCDDPFAPSSSRSRPRHTSGSSSSRMLLDRQEGSSPPSSPTLGRSALPTPKSSRKPANRVSMAMMQDMDDEDDDNPFLARGPAKAQNNKGKSSIDRDKVSYVL